MSAELLLLREFERVGDAPDAIRNLRPFIVELALRGDLTATTPERSRGDAVDLPRIHRGMETLVSLRPKYRWKKPVSGAANHSETPPGWRSTELANTGLYINGLPFKPSDWGQTGRPIIRIQNLSGQNRDYHYTEGEFPRDNLADSGDLLVSWSATLDTFVWDGPEGVVNQHIFKVIPNTEAVTSGFLYWLLKHEVRRLAHSQHAHGLAMMHINRGPFLSHSVALPPLSEQHRIVAKVDELMALCDQMEAAEKVRELVRDALRSASLHRLKSIDDNANGTTDVRFFLKTSTRLITKPEHVAAVRCSIRALAVEGRLVPQDPSEEPVAQLLSRVGPTREYKLRGKKNAHVMAGIQPDTELVAPSVPSSWQIVSLARLIIDGPRNGISPRETKRADAPKALTLTATTSGSLDLNQYKRVDLRVESDSEYWLQPGDLLFQRGNTREYVGIAAYYEGEPGKFLYPDLMIRVRLSTEVSLAYIHLCTLSPYARSYMSGRASGAQQTMPKINQDILLRLPIPLPPVAEQLRIVAKVDELMAVCDELEEALASAQDGRGRLLESLLHDALDGARVPMLVGAGQ